MRILLLSSNDYANLSWLYSNALAAVGVDAQALTLSRHPFGYKDQAIEVNAAYIKSIYRSFDRCIVMHSCPLILSYVSDHPHLIVAHTGTAYRDNPLACNEMFNPVVKRCISDQCEFEGLGAKDLSYIAPYVTESRKPKRDYGKLVVGHFPSNEFVKGTAEIRKMLEPFKDDYEIRIDTTLVSHEENIKRMADCHLYIELFKPELNGKSYGCFGVTGFEAAALGCYVITNNINESAYTSVYGPSYFRIANTEEEFKKVFEVYRTLKPEDYCGLLTPDRFYENHSLHSTGYRLLNITS